jgi:DNA-binding CsgD family transcriptional regulator
VGAVLPAAQVEIALAAGDIDEAGQAADELDEVAAVYGSCGIEVAARHARGALLLADERPDAALPVLRDACRAWSDVDAPYDCARVRILLVRAYRQLGDQDAADRELEVAIAAFDRLGAVSESKRARELRSEHQLPGGLTPREIEVLTLVAGGRTNKSIARSLAVSEKTVARHLANVFAKLGVSSRTAAAAFAFENGLAGSGPEPPGPTA